MTDLFGTLVRYAHTRPDLPPPCYRIRPINWVLDIRSDGVTIEPFGEADAVPTMRRSGSLPMPMLAVDHAAYVLGVTGDGVTEAQAKARTTAFWTQMGQWMTGPNAHPAVGAGIALAQVQGTVASEHAVAARSTVAVRVEGIWLHRLPEALAEWVRIVSALKGGAAGLCVACGQVRVLAETLPNAIPGHLVPGAEHDASLTVLPQGSRNKGETLPVCVSCGDLAANALQTLLSDPTRTASKKGQSSVTTAFGFGGPAADAEAVLIARALGAVDG